MQVGSPLRGKYQMALSSTAIRSFTARHLRSVMVTSQPKKTIDAASRRTFVG